MNNYNLLKIQLTNFIGARIVESENFEGHMETGVFIPLEQNGLKADSKSNVSAYAFVNKSTVATKETWEYYIQLKMQRNLIDKLKALGFKNTPYIGAMKTSSYTISKDTANY